MGSQPNRAPGDEARGSEAPRREAPGVDDDAGESGSAAYEALFEQAPVAMVAVGPDRSIRLNQAAVELFGRSNEEMRAQAFLPDSPWIPPDQAELWAEMRRKVTIGERVTGVRFTLVRPNGERRQAEVSSIPIVYRGGSPGGVVTVLTDLTDRLSLEAQLRHAQKMEALGRLAGGIAHDFNNVLMGILGYAEMVAADARGARVELRDAEQVVMATRRAIDLAGRLTAFARREASRTEIVDVARLVEDVLPLLRRLAPETIGVETRLDADQFVRVDRSELEQSIMNLAVNAIDAMPGGGRLSIEVEGVELDEKHASAHVGSRSGPHVMVAVSDTGAGMDEATRARIFEPFFTTKPVGEGTGLGLAMVFGAVQRSHGRIWVYSEPGRGTTFKMYLPVEADRPDDAPTTGDELMPGGTESILAVEDDDLVREVLDRTLQRLGYEVTIAGLPSEALALAAARRFDLLVTDVVMPEMTGDQLATAIRASQPDLPVVFMSAYTAGVLDLELGPRDVFASKPLSAGRLARAAREALDRGGGAGTR